MSTKEVSALITKLLCRNRGCMEYREVYHALLSSRSDEDLLALLSDSSRFIVTGDSKQSEKRPAPQPGAGSKVIAKTSVRLCRSQTSDGGACRDLHLCKLLVCGHCRFGEKCKYSHKVHNSHNSNILTEEGLQDLDQLELFLLLLQNDHCLLPEICSHYNVGSGKHGSCTYKKECFNLHICKYFLQGDCMFGNKCRRTHRFDERSITILKGRGFKVDLNSERILYEIYKNRFMITTHLEKAAEVWQSESSSSVMKVIEANSSEICLYFILGQCRYKEKCRNMHYDLPYRWQILNSDGVTWTDHPNMEAVERAYSNPENDVSEGLPAVNFLTMKCGSAEVRRLSTLSSVAKESSHFLTTEWLWHWKDSEGQWRQYGCEREEKSEASSASHTLEKSYLGDINGRMCISIGRKEFSINFKDMCQQNHDNQAQTEVRRRPRFIPASEVERKRSRVTPEPQSSCPESPSPPPVADVPVLLCPPQQMVRGLAPLFRLQLGYPHPQRFPFPQASPTGMLHLPHHFRFSHTGHMPTVQLSAVPPYHVAAFRNEPGEQDKRNSNSRDTERRQNLNQQPGGVNDHAS